jgi:hypothetical protein
MNMVILMKPFPIHSLQAFVLYLESLHTSTRGNVPLRAVGACERGVQRTWEVGLEVAILERVCNINLAMIETTVVQTA